ncbi:futalosine hydrolase, partial [Nitratidesulfovibrio liaohensis]|uniref:futalosine hydrolase n=1 Tax=Nitratidesulfovibrio liaohensis TaxID=2604158 RepID=UPI0014220264
HRSVRGVLNLGVAGTFDVLRAPLGSAVLASAEVWPEYGLAGDDGVDPQGIAFPQAEGPAGPVWDRIDLAPEVLLEQWHLAMPVGARSGVALTVAGVSGTPARAQAMCRRHSPLMENMEGFSLALACLRHNLPFAEVRTMSNIVGSRAAEDWALEGALDALGALARELFLTD